MKKHAEETWECATVSGRDLVLLLDNCADTIEIYMGRSRFDSPKQSSRDPHATNLLTSLRSEGLRPSSLREELVFDNKFGPYDLSHKFKIFWIKGQAPVTK